MKVITIDTETLRWSSEVGKTEDGDMIVGDLGLAVAVIGSEEYVSPHERRSKAPDLSYTVYLPCGDHAVFDSQNDVSTMFTEAHSLEYVQEEIDEAELIVGFNTESFDFEVMKSAGFRTSGWLDKSFDICKRFEEATRQKYGEDGAHRITLDSLAKNLLKEEKSLSGPVAVDFWRSGLQLVKQANGITEYRRRFAKASDKAFFSVWLDQQIATSDQLTRTAHHLFEQVVSYCKRDVELTYRIYQELVEQDGELRYYNWRTRGRPKIKLRMGLDIEIDDRMSAPDPDRTRSE